MQRMSACLFGAVAGDGGTGDHNFSARDVLRTVSLKDDCAKIRQTVGDCRTLEIGPGDLVAESEQHFGNAAHPDSTDTYKMNALNLCKHGFFFCSLSRSAARNPTRLYTV